MENQQGKKSEEASPTFFFSASIYPNLSILFRPQESFECVFTYSTKKVYPLPPSTWCMPIFTHCFIHTTQPLRQLFFRIVKLLFTHRLLICIDAMTQNLLSHLNLKVYCHYTGSAIANRAILICCYRAIK